MCKKTQHYCVIGHPVAHSLSPAIHRFIGTRLGITLSFAKRHIAPQALASFVRSSRSGSWNGYSVTLPHKESIIPLLDRVDESAEAVGAVNTVVRRDRTLTGYNTDAAGLREALRRSGAETIRTAVIIGAGGAARAGLAALADMECSQVILLNRTPERAGSLTADFRGRFRLLDSGTLSEQVLAYHLLTADLLINATPVGMWPNREQSLLKDGSSLRPEITVMDMVPNPPRTLLLDLAEQRGCRTVSGLDMLIAQAIAAQEIWQGRILPTGLFDDLRGHMLEMAYE